MERQIKNEAVKERIVDMGLYEKYCEYFGKIARLCIEAYKCDEVTTEKYFIDNGIPEDFMKRCKKAHLYGGGKNGANIFFNWHKNRKYPKNTVDNFLDYIQKKEGK